MGLYSAFGATAGPTAVNAGQAATRGMEFYVTSAAWATELRIYKGGTNGTGTVTGRLYTVGAGGTTGTAVTGTDVTFTGFGSGWNIATLATPVALTPNQRYRVAVLSQTYESETSAYFTTGAGSAGITNGPLVVPSRANATGTMQGSYNIATTLGYPGSDQPGTNFWVDVTVTDIDPARTYRLFPGVTPTGEYALSTEYYSKGHEFYPTRRCWATGVWVWRSTTAPATTATGALFTADAGGATGSEIANTRVTLPTNGAGWVFQAFPAPVDLAVGTRYRVVAYFANTRFGHIVNYWTTGAGSAGITAGPIFAPTTSQAFGGAQVSYKVNSTNVGIGFPTVNNSGEWDGLDVGVIDIDPTGRAQTQFFPLIR